MLTLPSDGSPSPSTPAVRSAQSPAYASAATGALAPRPVVDACDHCRAPVDHAQRYCVQCGSHQRRSDDPTARWFAAARRAKLAPAAVAAGGDASGSRTVPYGVAALLIALLPISAGIGVIVGRGTDDSGKQVVEALKAVSASGGLATAGGAGAAGAGADATTADASSATDDSASKADEKTKKVGKIEVGKKQAPILATGPTGSARQLTDTKPTAKDVDESKKALQKIEASKGEDYVEQQRDLPDTIVIP